MNAWNLLYTHWRQAQMIDRKDFEMKKQTGSDEEKNNNMHNRVLKYSHTDPTERRNDNNIQVNVHFFISKMTWKLKRRREIQRKEKKSSEKMEEKQNLSRNNLLIPTKKTNLYRSSIMCKYTHLLNDILWCNIWMHAYCSSFHERTHTHTHKI